MRSTVESLIVHINDARISGRITPITGNALLLRHRELSAAVCPRGMRGVLMRLTRRRETHDVLVTQILGISHLCDIPIANVNRENEQTDSMIFETRNAD